MKALVYGLLAVVLIGVFALGWHLWPRRQAFLTDADRIRESAEMVITRDVLWQPPEPLPLDVINSGGDDYEPRLSWDGLQLFFVRGKAGENADIYTSTRTPDGWTEPRLLDAVQSPYDDLGPEPSADGNLLYFYSDRPGGHGGYDIWVSRRTDTGWSAATNLGPAVNSEFNDYGPAVSPDGLMLYFASNRPLPADQRQPNPDAWPATLREDLFYRTYDLYAARLTDAGASPAVALAALNTPYNEGTPAISPVGDFLYFSSDRPGGQGAFDLYRCRRLGDELVRTESLGAQVNTTANELDPGLTMGGYALYFSSNREADGAPLAGEQDYNVYTTTSREVFTDYEIHQNRINWMGLWRQAGPSLLWLLTLLALLLLLARWFKDVQWRELSLLMRCLIASLLAHLLLLMLLSLMQVTSSLAGWSRSEGGVQIALTPSAEAGDLFTQVRGDLVNVDAPAPADASIDRADAAMDIDATFAMASLDVPREPVRVELTSTADVDVPDAEALPRAELQTARPEIERAQRDDVQVELPKEARQVADAESSVDDSNPLDAAADAMRAPRAAAAMSQQVASVLLETKLDQSIPIRQTRLDHRPLESPVREAAVSTALDMPRPDAPARAAADVRRDVSLSLPEVGQRVVEAEAAASVDMPIAAAPVQPRASVEWSPGVHSDVNPRVADITDTDQPVSVAATPIWNGNVQDLSDSSTARATQEAASDSLRLASLTSPTARDWSASALHVTLPSAERTEAVQDQEQAAVAAPAVRSATPRANDAIALRITASIEQDVPTGALSSIPSAGDSASLADNALQSLADASPSSAPVELTPKRTLPPNSTRLASLRLPEDRRVDAEDSRQESMPTVSTTRQTMSMPRAAPDGLMPAPASSAIVETSELPTLDVAHAATADIRSIPEAGSERATDTPNSIVDVPMLASLHRIPNVRAAELALPSALPDAPVALPDGPFGQRSEEQRVTMLDQFGGDDETERAVALALRWLARHQSADGRWDGDGFDASCHVCEGQTDAPVDAALTGLSLLCFLGADHTHTKPGPYRDEVEHGLSWLLSIQQRNGDLRNGNETMYSQGIATIALSEAYAMTGDERLAGPVRRAVRFILKSRDRRGGGWRYDPGQAGDTSVSGWQLMALKSARMAGFEVPAEGFQASRDWLDLVSTPEHPGLYAYQPGQAPSHSMTAEGMFMQSILGRSPDEPRMLESAELVASQPPDWDGYLNTYAWYYGTLGLFQRQDAYWEAWNEKLKPTLIEHQRSDGPAAGSWDPLGEWAPTGGRVYQTAICTLMLEVYYRYLPMLSEDQPADAIGAIRGVVRHAETEAPLAGVTVRLDLPDQPPVIAHTDYAGAYRLYVPEVPDHFALSASKDGFVPDSVDVEADDLEGTILQQDFALTPLGLGVIAIEADPVVHHLGNDAFSGSINSQFQRDSEGTELEALFTVSADQLALGGEHCEVRLLAKGVQCPHEIRINGVPVEQRMENSPRDGSFGEYAGRFDASLLRAGDNTIGVYNVYCRDDVDDFEFVNVRIVLAE